MSASTGPVLAMGGITLLNSVVLNGQPLSAVVRIPVGTAIAAAGLALLERASPELAVGLAWLGLVAVLLVRVDPKQPAPVENLQKWYAKGKTLAK